MKRAAALLITVMLLLAACGDDDAGTTEADEALVGDLTQEILEGSTTGADAAFTEEQAACFAVGLLDEFGADAMVEALQMDFEEFMAEASTDERMTVVDTMLECVDFGAVMVAELEGEISAESAACIGDAFGDSEAFRTALANSFDGSTADPLDDPALIQDVLPAILQCLTEDELAELFGGSSDG